MMHTGTFEALQGAGAHPAAVDLSDTEWGYIIRPGEKALTRAAYGEIAASFAAVLLGMAAFGQWLIPGTSGAFDLVPFKIGATVIFFLGASFLYLISRRGLCYEVQIDLARRVMRTARRNRNGHATALSVVPIAEVESVFMQRAKSAFLFNRLFVRIAGARGVTEIAMGPERELAPILQRLSRDLRKKEAEVRIPRRPARAPTKTVRTAFAGR